MEFFIVELNISVTKYWDRRGHLYTHFNKYGYLKFDKDLLDTLRIESWYTLIRELFTKKILSLLFS